MTKFDVSARTSHDQSALTLSFMIEKLLLGSMAKCLLAVVNPD